MKKIFLFGWFGENNVGDDALLNQTLEEINSITNDVSITIFTNNCKSLEEDLNLKNVNFRSKNLKNVIKATKDYDIFVFGPGGLFPNRDLKKLMFIYFYISYLKFLKKQIVFFGLGVENCNFESFFNRNILKRIFSKCDKCALRFDPKQYINSDKIYKNTIAAADVMYLKKYPKLYKNNHNKYVVISLANIFETYSKEKENFISSIKPLLLKLIEDGNELHFLTFTKNKDEIINSETIESLGKFKNYCLNIPFTKDLNFIFQEFANCEMVVGMRYHSLVFATNYSKPFIPVSYSSKIEELLYDFNLSFLSNKLCFFNNKYFCEKFEIDQGKILMDYIYIKRNYNEIKKMIEENLKIERKKAKHNTEILSEFLSK